MADASTSGRPKEEENLEVGLEMKLGEVFGNAQVITNTEVSEILAEYENAMKEQEGQGYTSNQVFQSAKEYVDRFKSFKNRATSIEIQKSLTETYNLSEFEKGLMINLAPEDIEEAKILIPSLEDETRFADEDIEKMLSDLATYKNFE